MVDDVNIESKLKRYLGVLCGNIPSIDEHKHDIYIAGGAIVDLIYNENLPKNVMSEFEIATSPKDIDIYVDDNKTLLKLVDIIKKSDFFQSETKYAITFIINDTIYQLIKFRTGTPTQIVNNFDFIHTMTSYRYDGVVRFHHPKTNDCIKNKILILGNSIDFLFTYSRLFKFLSRGYKIEGSWSNDLLYGIVDQVKDDPDRVLDEISSLDESR